MVGTTAGHAGVEPAKDAWKSNQWLGLLEALVSLRAWKHSAQLAAFLYSQGVTDPGMHAPIWRSLCTSLQDLTANVYASISPATVAATTAAATAGTTFTPVPVVPTRKPSPFVLPADTLEPAASLADVPRVIKPALALLGIHLSNDTRLYIHLCRLLATILAPPASDGLSTGIIVCRGADSTILPKAACVHDCMRSMG